jgi:hypothetical protein
MTEQDKQPPFQPTVDKREPDFNAPWNEMNQLPPTGLPFNPFMQQPITRKRKFVAGLLSFLVPGTGHFYLGQMQRGIMVMLAIILDIFAIVQLSISVNISIPLITLFSLLLPVIYFFSIFDALQLTDRINNQHHSLFAGPNQFFGVGSGDPLQSFTRGNRAGWLLIGVGALFFLLSRKPAWLTEIVSTMGSYIGALILIVIGAYLFLRKNDNK